MRRRAFPSSVESCGEAERGGDDERAFRRKHFDRVHVASTLFSALLHTLFLGGLAWTARAARVGDLGVSGEDLDLMRSYLARAEQIEQRPHEGYAGRGDDSSSSTPGGTGSRAEGDKGAMGLRSSENANERYAAARLHPSEGVAEDDEATSLAQARAFGMVGLLARFDSKDGEANDAWASAPREASGAMWGTAVGDAFGFGGLDLSGVGEGGGGRGAGVGLGDVGTIGRGAGRGGGEDFGEGSAGSTCDAACVANGGGRGFGVGHGRIGEGHHASTIVCHLSFETATGRLPPETIQRVVHESLGRFRHCYEQGLMRAPSLRGRVATKFVIARDGSVGAVADAGSDLPDAAVTSCVQRRFGELSFPEPPSGVVTVVYPITFSPE